MADFSILVAAKASLKQAQSQLSSFGANASKTITKFVGGLNAAVGTAAMGTLAGLALAMAGGAADCQFWEKYVAMQCRVYELRNGEKPSVAMASMMLASIMRQYLGYGLSMGTMFTGSDKTGASLYYMDNDATRLKGSLFAVGSGGTLGGVALSLRAANPAVKIGLVDPYGAALFAYYTEGEFKSEGGSITEGIGQGRITANLEGFTPDLAYRVSDQEMLERAYQLLEEEGLFLGGSAALNVAGAIKMAADMPKGSTIVTILCDSGGRYASKMYNPEFLRSKDLPTPPWMEG